MFFLWKYADLYLSLATEWLHVKVNELLEAMFIFSVKQKMEQLSMHAMPAVPVSPLWIDYYSFWV